MKSKHGEEESEKENGERWLLTYSDLITLLLALFIILYTMSNIDLEKMKQLSQGLNEAFNNSSSSAGAGAGAGAGNSNSGAGTETSASGYSGNAAQPSALDEIYVELSNYIKENNLENKIDLESTDTYVKVRLKDVVLFVPDSSQMLEQSEPILTEIEKALSGVYDRIDRITISGHTADPSNDQNVSSAFAWQLSSGRAVTVLNYMVSQGLPQYKLSIEANSHFIPIADNATAEGRAKNRRVEITITKNDPATASVTGTNTATTTVTTAVTTSETTTAATTTKAETTKKKKK